MWPHRELNWTRIPIPSLFSHQKWHQNLTQRKNHLLQLATRSLPIFFALKYDLLQNLCFQDIDLVQS